MNPSYYANTAFCAQNFYLSSQILEKKAIFYHECFLQEAVQTLLNKSNPETNNKRCKKYRK